jgi:hypothetical protein
MLFENKLRNPYNPLNPPKEEARRRRWTLPAGLTQNVPFQKPMHTILNDFLPHFV